MKETKGQAGLDFLMTYGWALLLIVLVVGALFALGIFDIGNFTGNKASGFTEIGAGGWRMTPAGALTMQFKNTAGTTVNITTVNATYGAETISYNSSFAISNGQSSNTISVGTFTSPPSSGASYTVRVHITYTDTKTGFVYGDAGTITGKAS